MSRLHFLIICFFLVISPGIKSQDKNTALVLIDIQEFYFDPEAVPLEGNLEAAEQAKQLLEHFREKEGMIIHVMHKGGGEIHDLVKPLDGETVIVKTKVNAFRETELEKILKENHITTLILAGMQTQMCLEAATRAGSDLGYQCTVIHDACAARDLEFQGHVTKAADVHASTLNTLMAYAKVISTEEYLMNTEIKE